MRRIIMFDRVTADGYFAAQDGNLNWAVPDEELDRDGARSAQSPGTMLFGRKTYQMFESFWRPVAEGATTPANPHGARSESMQTFARFINEGTKIVFSRTLKEVTWKNSRLLSEFDPGGIASMKNEAGSDMIIFGSGSIVSQLAEHNLIDDYNLTVSPVILGSGRSLITGLTRTLPLELVEVKQYASGNVTLRYAPA